MASVPIYTAQGRQVQGHTPSHIPLPESGGAALAEGLAHLGKSVIEVDAKLRQQQDERTATEAAAKWEIGQGAIRENLWRADPDDIQSGPEGSAAATIPAPRDVEATYKSQMVSLTEGLEKNLSPGAQAMFAMHVARSFPSHVINVRHELRNVAAQHEVAGLDRMEENYAAMAVTADTPAERQTYINGFTSALDRAAQRGMLDPVLRQNSSDSVDDGRCSRNRRGNARRI